MGPGLGVLRERLRLASGPVQGQHELPARPLPPGVRGNDSAQARDDRVDLAESELGVEQVCLAPRPLLVEPADRVPGEGGIAKVRQSVAAPERQRGRERAPGRCRIAAVEGCPTLGREGLEAGAVELLVAETQEVTGGGGLDALGAERAPQP